MEAERAILVPRVSAKSNTQTEYEMNQLPGMQAYADGKGYIVEPDAIIPIYGKSAFHGRHLKILGQRLTRRSERQRNRGDLP